VTSADEHDPSLKPLIDLPVVDAHTHLFPPEVVAHRQRFLDRDPWFGQAFGHPAAKTAAVDELIASMNQAGIARSIVCGWPWRDLGTCRAHNDYLAAVGREYPDRISWLGIVNPVDAGAAAETLRCAELGAAGIGELNADGQGFDWNEPKHLRAFADACIKLDLPALIHTSEPVGHVYPGKGQATPEKLLTFFAVYPELRVIAAHWGGGLPIYELMPEVALLTKNVVYDTAASTYLYGFGVFPVVERLVGAERILFGSDFPVLKQRRFLRRVTESGLSPDALVDILCGNASRVFRLPQDRARDGT